MRAPQSLGRRGSALWQSIAAGLPKGWELDEREVAILTMAARQADDVERFERIVKKDGAMVEGSAGLPVLHPALVEARQGCLAVQRLLGQLELPDEEEPRNEAGKRGQRAARTRWDRRANVEARRGAA